MAVHHKILAGFLIFLSIASSSNALISHPKAIYDLKEAIVKGLGFQTDDFKISGFDIRDALVGQSVAYEFDIEVDNKVLPFKLLEDVNRWEYVDLPIFRTEDENGLVEKKNLNEGVLPVLAPFQLAGPMELWIQDAKDMRVSLPHDVDAGVLKKVILADGAVVTVKGARSVSLRHPLDLPLPLNSSNSGLASGLLTLAEHLRLASQTEGGPLVSLRIVGPTSLTSPSSSSSPSSGNKLKLKRLAPGLVELSSLSKKAIEPAPIIDSEKGMTLLEPNRFTTMWPLASINGSSPNLRGFEALLHSVLGGKAKEQGSFKLLKAEASAQTFVKMVFGVEKELKEGDGLVDWNEFPEWKTKPESVRMHFEVLAKVDGEKIVAEKVVQVDPVRVEDSVAPNVIMGNVTMSKIDELWHTGEQKSFRSLCIQCCCLEFRHPLALSSSLNELLVAFLTLPTDLFGEENTQFRRQCGTLYEEKPVGS
ncbi:tunicamycin induced protein [Thalictrum thalictroides]|uniref:Tunicamycin induced protein n=1 Tax=Thalictrum thalictroides TaxID=46969 RepID=A0A7J6VLC8_THATH|nr:tunicamycin induced protein [Thalictrum thalictroides]